MRCHADGNHEPLGHPVRQKAIARFEIAVLTGLKNREFSNQPNPLLTEELSIPANGKSQIIEWTNQILKIFRLARWRNAIGVKEEFPMLNLGTPL
jgi:hypothetical protein